MTDRAREPGRSGEGPDPARSTGGRDGGDHDLASIVRSSASFDRGVRQIPARLQAIQRLAGNRATAHVARQDEGEAGAAEPSAETEGMVEVISDQRRRVLLRLSHFDREKAELKPAHRRAIQDLHRRMLPALRQAGHDDPAAVFGDAIAAVRGHASAEGSDRYNRQLSARRANAVIDYLTGSFDIGRPAAFAMGEERAFRGPEGYPLDRKVEIEFELPAPAPSQQEEDQEQDQDQDTPDDIETPEFGEEIPDIEESWDVPDAVKYLQHLIQSGPAQMIKPLLVLWAGLSEWSRALETAETGTRMIGACYGMFYGALGRDPGPYPDAMASRLLITSEDEANRHWRKGVRSGLTSADSADPKFARSVRLLQEAGNTGVIEEALNALYQEGLERMRVRTELGLVDYSTPGTEIERDIYLTWDLEGGPRWG